MKYKIMIVDDEPVNLRTLERLFRQHYQVVTAQSGAEALALLEQHDVALLISDQRMPETGTRHERTRRCGFRAFVRPGKSLRTGDLKRGTAIQFGSHLDLLSDWTTDREQLIRAVNTKLISGRRPQLIKALFAAALRLKEVPAGRRHIVLITDGVDSSDDAAALNGAIRQTFYDHR